MSSHKADSNYQQRSLEFNVGDLAVPYGMNKDSSGRVVAVYPAIGMIELQFPHGNRRYPAEDLQRFDAQTGTPSPPYHDTVPGGVIQKVAVYWIDLDRKFRATKTEMDLGQYQCPKCKEVMKRTSYKRQNGMSVRLLACPSCLFLVRVNDIEGCHHIPEE